MDMLTTPVTKKNVTSVFGKINDLPEEVYLKNLLDIIEPEQASKLLKVFDLQHSKSLKKTIAIIAVQYVEQTSTQELLEIYNGYYKHSFYKELNKYIRGSQCLNIKNNMRLLHDTINNGNHNGYSLISLKLCLTATELINNLEPTFKLEYLLIEMNKPINIYQFNPLKFFSKKYSSLANGNIIPLKSYSKTLHQNLKYELNLA